MKKYIEFLVYCELPPHFFGEYVSGRLSICPICHIQIPTVTPRKRISREKYGKQPGLGPLPDFCPFCGANFRDNK